MKTVRYKCAVPMACLTRRADFVALTHDSKQHNSSSITPGFILQLKPMAEGTAIAMGFTATKKLGNAVTRSTAKRRLRAVVDQAMRLNEDFAGHQTGQGYHLNLIARSACLTRSVDDMTVDLKKVLKYHGFQWKS